MEKVCWTCGHFLIGGGCWKDGMMNQPGWKEVEVDHVCDEWCPEGTEGTVTDYGDGEADGSSWADNEYLQD